MQLNLIPKTDLRAMKAFSLGGSSLKKRRKIKRPLINGVPTHVVFKSSKATGNLSFYAHKKLVSALLKEKSRKFYIEVLDWVNMGNHLHLKIRFKDRKYVGKFLKSFSATLARKITGAKKGNRFWKILGWIGLYSNSKLEVRRIGNQRLFRSQSSTAGIRLRRKRTLFE